MSLELIITIAGSALGLIAIIQTWRIHRINKRDRIKRGIEFYYEVKKALSVVDIPFSIMIHFNSKHFKNIFYVEGIIGNKGNIVFTKGDLLKPLKLSSKTPIEILDFEIIDKTKNELECDIVIDDSENPNTMTFLINNFEPKDAFKFKMLIGSSDTLLTLDLDGLIKDENINIKPRTIEVDKSSYYRATERGLDESTWPFIIGIPIAIVVGFYYLFLWIQSLFFYWLKNVMHFALSSSEVLSFTMGIISIILIIGLIVLLLKKIRLIDRLKKEPKNLPTVTGFGPWFDLRIRTKDPLKHLN